MDRAPTRLRRFATVTSALRRGWFGLLRAKFTRGTFAPAVFRWNHLRILALEDVPSSPPISGFATRWAGPHELEALLAVRNRPEDFLRFFDAGAVCVLGSLESEPACFAWLQLEDVYTSRANAYEIRLQPDECWAFACEVRERWRGRGLYRALWHDTALLLAEHGIRRALLGVHADDERSLRVHAKLGFRPLRSLRVLRALGLSFHWADDGGGVGQGIWVGP